MNRVVISGRLTKDPDIRQSGETKIARYTLAVDRRVRQGEEKKADFITCVAFSKSADFAERYLRKGTKIIVSGRIQTGSYQRQDGTTVYTTDVVAEDQEFEESKQASDEQRQQAAVNGQAMGNNDGGSFGGSFMQIPDGIEEELPFK